MTGWRFGLVFGLTAALVVVGTANGCRPMDLSDEDDGAGGSATTGPVGGAGGEGGAGGAGGEVSSACGIDCATISTPDCHEAVCNEGLHPGPVGQCVVVAQADGTACDDGAFCTTDDTCQAGVCTGGPANDCGMVPDECQAITCDETTDVCGTEPLANGTACTSSDLCLTGTTCNAGVCSGGIVKDCFFAPVPNECHVAECNPNNGMCEPVPGNEGQPCTDVADLCTINNSCSGGVCGGGIPKDCSHLTLGCDLGVCSAATGQCTTMSVMDGQQCDDLDACTTGEICSMGSCGNGSPVTSCSLASDGCCPANCTAVNDFDCACMTSSLSTPFNSNNGLDGNMFDIVALANIEIQSFSVNISAGSKTIEIYYRPGSYVGHESSAFGWTLAGSATVTSNGQDQPTPVPAPLSINIPAGQTYGFYVTTTAGGIRYTDGSSVGAVAAQNSHLQILQGAGKSYPFGTSTFTTRVFNGIAHYQVCGM